MKTKVDNYVFVAADRTVTFTDYATVRLDGILLVTNVTHGIILFNFADPAKGGTVQGNILTLAYDTTSMADADSLQIYYDDPASGSSDSTVIDVSDNEAEALLVEIRDRLDILIDIMERNG